jgi:5-methyltetrahydrofolate--homocysteine methyltransferase
MDDGGIPKTPEGRIAAAEKIIDRAVKYGIPVEDVVIDPLAMAMGSDHTAGRVALETMALVRDRFGVNITLGASNISFGLPDRKYVNAAFIAMAVHAGLTCPITNPLVTEVRTAVLAADLAMGRDEYGTNWITDYRKRNK